MKKIGLLIACMMFLSGCTATNGLVSKKDIDNLDYKEMNTMVEEQKDISYIPDDVKEFLKQVEEASKNQMETSYGYLDIKSSMMGYYGKNSEFLHEVYISEDLNDDEKVDSLLKAIDDLNNTVGMPKSIKEAGVSEDKFYATLDEMVEQAFDDQCTGANPRYPLMSEIKQIYINAYEGKKDAKPAKKDMTEV